MRICDPVMRLRDQCDHGQPGIAIRFKISEGGQRVGQAATSSPGYRDIIVYQNNCEHKSYPSIHPSIKWSSTKSLSRGLFSGPDRSLEAWCSKSSVSQTTAPIWQVGGRIGSGSKKEDSEENIPEGQLGLVLWDPGWYEMEKLKWLRNKYRACLVLSSLAAQSGPYRWWMETLSPHFRSLYHSQQLTFPTS